MNIKHNLRISVLPFIIILLNAVTLHSQDIKEILLEQQRSENSDILDLLEELKANPVNINTATEKSLSRLPFFDIITAEKIKHEQLKNGQFKSAADFAGRMEFDPHFVMQIAPYICFRSRKKHVSANIRIRTRVMTVIEKSKGFRENKFKGSPLYTYNRLSISSDKFIVKSLVHKDPGEPSYFDHISGFFLNNYQNKRIRLIFGDFLLKLGQGLTVWGPYSQFKGSECIKAAKNSGSDLSGYCSSTEYGFFRGFAIEAMQGIMVFRGVLSYKRSDGTLNPDSTVRSFSNSGLHRTAHELSLKNSVIRKTAGLSATVEKDNFSAGVMFFRNSFLPAINPEKSEKNFFRFRGNAIYNYGAYWDILLKNTNLYGEVSFSDPGSFAYVAGLITNRRKTKFALTVYSFSKDFYNFHSSFLSVSPAKNKNGIYVGIKHKFTKKLSLSFYADMTKTPWRTYSIPMPCSSTDLYWKWLLRINKKYRFNFLIRYKTGLKKSHNSCIENSQFRTDNTANLNLRFESQYSISEKSIIRIRFENKFYSDTTLNHPEKGRLFFIDFSTGSERNNISVKFTKFNTSSYLTRIYQYEKDVPGVFSNSMLYGRGFRLYLYFLIRLNNSLTFYTKWSCTFYSDRNKISSGYNQIAGNKINKVKIQFDYNF